MSLLASFIVIFFAGFAIFGTSGQSVPLGSFRALQHQVRGDVYAIDEKTIRIENFSYDGTGVRVFLFVFRRSGGGGIVVNWSLFESEIPRRRFGFNGREDFTISLLFNRPNIDLLVSELSSITIWCEPFNAFFGRLDNIPAELTNGTLAAGPQMVYCIQLHNNLQVTIGYNENMIRIKQCGCIDEDQYMAFGISGSNTSTNMVGADVVVTWINDDGPNAIDYYLTSRQQCRGGDGVCPDTLLASGTGTQDASIVSGDVTNSRRCIEYSRPLRTDDPNDRSFLLNGQSQFLAWAYGPRAVEESLRNLAFFHIEYPRNGGDMNRPKGYDTSSPDFMLDFAAGEDSELRCSSELSCSTSPAECPGWNGLNITATEPTTFRVRIGISGGLRGYQSITGLSGWGIAYYINDTLIPMLRLRRNVTYTFIVEAGDNPEDGPNYHPFYITDSEDGGILLDTPEDRMRKNEQVFAGYDLDTNQPTAAGRLCEHIETDQSASVAADCNSELQEYLDTLDVMCLSDGSEAAILTWTPDENTPDVVYYQCANHIHLGWKIVFDDEVTGSGLDEQTGSGLDEATGSGLDEATGSEADRQPTTSIPSDPTDSGLDEATGSEADRQPTTSIPSDPTDSGLDEATDSGVDEATSASDEPVTSPEEPTGSEPITTEFDAPTASDSSQARISHLVTWLFLVLVLLYHCY